MKTTAGTCVVWMSAVVLTLLAAAIIAPAFSPARNSGPSRPRDSALIIEMLDGVLQEAPAGTPHPGDAAALNAWIEAGSTGVLLQRSIAGMADVETGVVRIDIVTPAGDVKALLYRAEDGRFHPSQKP